jgi:hypothetical protein
MSAAGNAIFSVPASIVGTAIVPDPHDGLAHAAAAVGGHAQYHEEASMTNQNATLAIDCESKDKLASSVSVEAGRLSPIRASSMDSHGQQHVQDVEPPSQNGLTPLLLTQGQEPSPSQGQSASTTSSWKHHGSNAGQEICVQAETIDTDG